MLHSAIGRSLYLGIASCALVSLPARAVPPEVYGYFRNSDLAGDLLPRLETRSATGPLDDLVTLQWNVLDELRASYEVQYGRVRVLADQSWPETENGGFANAGPTAGWTDRLTITAPGIADGASGSLVVRVRVDGSVASSGSGEACVLVNFGLAGNTQVSNCSFFDRVPEGDGFGFFDSHPITFNYGVRFEIVFEASADAGGFASTAGDARSDLSNTLTWQGVVEVRDPSAQPLTGYTIVSASGFDYTVPEPTTIALGVAAAATLAALSRRDSRPHSR